MTHPIARLPLELFSGQFCYSRAVSACDVLSESWDVFLERVALTFACAAAWIYGKNDENTCAIPRNPLYSYIRTGFTMKAKLVSPDLQLPIWEIRLERFPVVIGRGPDSQIQPVDPSHDETHCEIDEVDGRLVVRDLGSSRGTYVNGVAVDEATLMPGDTLTVAECSFVAAYEPQPARKARLELSLGCSADPPSEVVATFCDLVALLDRQREEYRRRYQGGPASVEPMFPDPPHPEHLEHLLVEELRRAEVDPAVIYAFEQTGLLVTDMNKDSLSREQLLQWQEALERYEDQHDDPNDQHRFPVGALALYGPDQKTTTMMVAAVLLSADASPIFKRWVGSNVRQDQQVLEEIEEFFSAYHVKSVVSVKENVGCPHEEGVDYPQGGDCPFCPYWQGKQSD